MLDEPELLEKPEELAVVVVDEEPLEAGIDEELLEGGFDEELLEVGVDVGAELVEAATAVVSVDIVAPAEPSVTTSKLLGT